MLLVAFLIVFFMLIIFAYLNMSSNIENTMHQSRASFKVCEQSDSDNCIEESNIDSSLKLLKIIAAKLREKSRERGKDG
jgi:Na+-transporting methylmalonyl-CoA/oxaloacetate decarboxylase gamma subunit